MTITTKLPPGRFPRAPFRGWRYSLSWRRPGQFELRYFATPWEMPDRDGSGAPQPDLSDEDRECGDDCLKGLLTTQVRKKTRREKKALIRSRDSGGRGPREAWWRGV
jgi:hypothetical protein